MARRVYLRLSEIIPVASCGHCMTREGLSYWPVARGRQGSRGQGGSGGSQYHLEALPAGVGKCGSM